MILYVLYSSSGWEVPAKMLPQSFACAGLIAAFGFLIFSYLGKIPRLIQERTVYRSNAPDCLANFSGNRRNSYRYVASDWIVCILLHDHREAETN